MILWATLHGLAKARFLLRLAEIKRVPSGAMLDWVLILWDTYITHPPTVWMGKHWPSLFSVQNFNTSQHRAVITTGLVLRCQMKVRRRGQTLKKSLDSNPYFLLNVNSLVLETLLASFLGSPSPCTQFILLPLSAHIIHSHDLCPPPRRPRAQTFLPLSVRTITFGIKYVRLEREQG